jgi:hypothetical protein
LFCFVFVFIFVFYSFVVFHKLGKDTKGQTDTHIIQIKSTKVHKTL